MKLSHNESGLDRVIRGIVGIVLIWLSVGPLNAFSGSVLGIVLFVVAIILLVTAAVGFCPLYRLLGVSTAKK